MGESGKWEVVVEKCGGRVLLSNVVAAGAAIVVLLLVEL